MLRRASRTLYWLVKEGQHWELEDTGHLQELATEGSWVAVGGLPPTYLFFLDVVFKCRYLIYSYQGGHV